MQTTPLMYAASHGWDDMVDLLILNGAQVNRQNEDSLGQTALMEAASSFLSTGSQPLVTVQALIAAGAHLHLCTAEVHHHQGGLFGAPHTAPPMTALMYAQGRASRCRGAGAGGGLFGPRPSIQHEQEEFDAIVALLQQAETDPQYASEVQIRYLAKKTFAMAKKTAAMAAGLRGLRQLQRRAGGHGAEEAHEEALHEEALLELSIKVDGEERQCELNPNGDIFEQLEEHLEECLEEAPALDVALSPSEQLEALYQQFHPAKLFDVDQLLVQWRGDEAALVRAVRAKFLAAEMASTELWRAGATSTAPAPASGGGLFERRICEVSMGGQAIERGDTCEESGVEEDATVCVITEDEEEYMARLLGENPEAEAQRLWSELGDRGHELSRLSVALRAALRAEEKGQGQQHSIGADDKEHPRVEWRCPDNRWECDL